jgi:hypothetical protein
MKTKTNMHAAFPPISKCSLGVAFVLILLVATLADAQLTPSDDAYVNSAAPTTNYGAATTLDLSSAADTAFIRFDLTAVPAGTPGSSIAKATLKLYVNSVTTAGSFNVDYVTGTWVEQTIKYNLQPAIGTTIASSVPLTTGSKFKYVEIDVTAAMVEWLNGTQANDGIALVANSPLVATFDSKESTSSSHPPELDVVFTSGGGITGITTASGSGLMGGGTSGTLNLSLTNTCAANQVLQWNGTAWVCANLKGSGTITGVIAGTDLTGGGTSGKVTLNLDTTKVPQLNAYNTFTVSQTILGSGNSDGLDATASAPGFNGVSGISYATTGVGAGLEGVTLSPSGFGVVGYGAGGGVYGVSNSNSGVGGNFTGFSAASGSTNNGTDGVDATGGNSDPANFTYGGNGVHGLGGTGSFQGGIGTLGVGGNSGTEGGIGESGVGGDGGLVDGPGGIFEGGLGSADGDGIDVIAGSGVGGTFTGDLEVGGAITAGTKDFKIDHPLDPANKYLLHASVESSEMMNIYTGNVTTNAQGEATVQLPEWFEVLNTDFRYQLTVIGQFAQAIIARKIESNRFEIRTNAPNVEVSWQVTGVRQDAYAKAHPLVVEEQKESRLQGFYIHPELYGAPEEKQIEWARHPQMMKQMKVKRGAPPASPLSPRAPVLPLRTTPAVGAGK